MKMTHIFLDEKIRKSENPEADAQNALHDAKKHKKLKKSNHAETSQQSEEKITSVQA
ncbi:MAG: hypothetical protein V1729_06110 [Candidatus Woesearchaeota archaeon]